MFHQDGYFRKNSSAENLINSSSFLIFYCNKFTTIDWKASKYARKDKIKNNFIK